MSTPAYSFSKFDTYDRCPQAYKLTYIDKIPVIKSDALTVGGIVHQIIAAYIKHLTKTGRVSDLEKLQQLTRQLGGAGPHELYRDIEDIMSLFANSFILNFPGNILVEQEVAFDRQWQQVDWLDPKVFFRAKIDLLVDTKEQAYIIDWKTDRSIPSPSAVHSSVQLLTYAYIASLLLPETEQFLIQFFYLHYNARPSRTLCRDEVSHIPALISAKANTIERERKFEPRLNPNCGWCGVRHHCTAYHELPRSGILTIETEDEAAKAAQTYAALAGLSADLRQALEAWVAQHGPITINKEKLDFYPVEKTLFDDSQTLATTLLKNGLTREQVWQTLYTSKTKLKGILKQLKRMDLWPTVEPLARKTTETHFEFRKIKEV
jgi:hypothetical protein